MSGNGESQTHNTTYGNVHGNVVQSGSMRDVHMHSSSLPDHRDPRLFVLGLVPLTTGLGLLVVLVAMGASILSTLTEPSASTSPFPWLPGEPARGPSSGLEVLARLDTVAGEAVVLVVAGVLAVNLLWTGWDLMGRRRHAWRQDAFAGQSSLWLSLLALALVKGYHAPAVPMGAQAAAAIAAVALMCRGGVRRRWGLVAAVGAGAALWFVPLLFVVWASGAPQPVRMAGTLVLLAGTAVPVLAVTAVPAACGAVVLRGWALGVVVMPALVLAAWGARSSPPVTSPVAPSPVAPSPVVQLPAAPSPVTALVVLVSMACAVVVAVVVSGLLGRGERPRGRPRVWSSAPSRSRGAPRDARRGMPRAQGEVDLRGQPSAAAVRGVLLRHKVRLLSGVGTPQASASCARSERTPLHRSTGPSWRSHPRVSPCGLPAWMQFSARTPPSGVPTEA